MIITTTLADIRKASPCEDGWSKLLDGLGLSRTEAKNSVEPLAVKTVLDHCGVDNALWVIDNVICDSYLSRCIAADIAEMVLHIFEKERPDDDRPRKAIEITRDEASTSKALYAAWAARDARTAARDARGMRGLRFAKSKPLDFSII